MNSLRVWSLRASLSDIAAVSSSGVVLPAESRTRYFDHLTRLPVTKRTQLDSYRVEGRRVSTSDFSWSAENAARRLSSEILRRESRPRFFGATLDEVIDELRRHAESGSASPRDLGVWLTEVGVGGRAMVAARALERAHSTHDVFERVDAPIVRAPADTYLSIPRSRWLLRGYRDGWSGTDAPRVVLRVRPGSPSRSAARGLRVDALIATLAHPGVVAPARVVSAWPDAGLVLTLDPSLDDLTRGAKDLLRVAQRLSHQASDQAA